MKHTNAFVSLASAAVRVVKSVDPEGVVPNSNDVQQVMEATHATTLPSKKFKSGEPGAATFVTISCTTLVISCNPVRPFAVAYLSHKELSCALQKPSSAHTKNTIVATALILIALSASIN